MQDNIADYDNCIKLINKEAEETIINGLVSFCEGKGILENDYQKRLSNPEQRFGCYWELYLAKAMYGNKIELKRPERAKSSNMLPSLDFYYVDTCKIWIEATVAERSLRLDELAKRSVVVDDFESGDVDDDEIKLRLTNAIDSKAKHIERCRLNNIVSESDKIVLAVNGAQIFGREYPNFEDNFRSRKGYPPPYIVQVLFQLGNECISHNEMGESLLIYDRKPINKENGSLVPTNYFNDDKTNFDGVIYSATPILDYKEPLGGDFIYVQNPLKDCDEILVKQLFDLCREVWVVRDKRIVNIKK